jgi:tripartite-type tricarboxylate transporter receptor subunit TctC
MTRRFIAAAFGIAGAAWASASVAQPAAESMQGRTMTLYISVGPGGGYDSYGRMVARGLGRHIPGNPTIIASNMPGGGGRTLGNYMYNVAPKDGSAIAIVQHTTVYDAAFGEQGVRFDSSRLNWIGSMASMTFVALVWHTTGIRTVEDAKKREVTVGATGPGATSFQYPALLNTLFGTRLKIITGYKGSPEVYHAVEQRELDGTGGLTWEVFRNARGDWIRDNKVNIFLQFALKRHAELPEVPTIIELARNPEEKQLLELIFKGLQFGMPFMVPPGVAPARIEMLRTAMTALAKDPEFLAEAKSRKFSIDHTDGATVQRLVGEIYAASQELKTRARSLLAGK